MRWRRPPNKITLGAVIRAVDKGPLAEVHGLRPHETASCRRQPSTCQRCGWRSGRVCAGSSTRSESRAGPPNGKLPVHVTPDGRLAGRLASPMTGLGCGPAPSPPHPRAGRIHQPPCPRSPVQRTLNLYRVDRNSPTLRAPLEPESTTPAERVTHFTRRQCFSPQAHFFGTSRLQQPRQHRSSPTGGRRVDPYRGPRGQRALCHRLRRQGRARHAAGPPLRDPDLHGRAARPGQVRRPRARATPTSSATPAAGPATTPSARW